MNEHTTDVPHADIGIGHNQPPATIDPEKLVDLDGLPALLAANYGPLTARGAELQAGVDRWLVKFIAPRPADWPADKAWPVRYVIGSDAENSKTSEFLQMLAKYAGGKTAASGEVHEARRKITDNLNAAVDKTTGFFEAMRGSIRTAMRVMENAQLGYMTEKAEAARRERERIAEAARVEADRALAAARAAQTDDAIAEAVKAEDVVAVAERAAEAPRVDLVRQTSTAGVTTTLRSNWKFRVVDIAALAKAVADGKAPAMFLAPNDSVINAAIKGTSGMRACAGLEIYDDATVSRRGG